MQHIYNSEDMEAAQVPSIDKWIKQSGDIYNEILLGLKKEWNLTIYNSMDNLEGIMLSEIS